MLSACTVCFILTLYRYLLPLMEIPLLPGQYHSACNKIALCSLIPEAGMPNLSQYFPDNASHLVTKLQCAVWLLGWDWENASCSKLVKSQPRSIEQGQIHWSSWNDKKKMITFRKQYCCSVLWYVQRTLTPWRRVQLSAVNWKLPFAAYDRELSNHMTAVTATYGGHMT